MNKLRVSLPLLAASAALLAALPAAAAPTSFGGKVFPLKPVGASNEYGTVALKPLGEQTAVEVHVVNVPPGVVQTVHIHHGTCAKVDRRIVYPLSPLVDGASDSIVDAPLATILATPSVVHVHSSYKNEHRSLACANLNPL